MTEFTQLLPKDKHNEQLEANVHPPDWVNPESARSLALQGAEVLLHPSNHVMPHCQEAMRTRCLENRVWAVTANRTAEDDRGDLRLEFTGQSQIVGPRGEVVSRAGAR